LPGGLKTARYILKGRPARCILKGFGPRCVRRRGCRECRRGKATPQAPQHLAPLRVLEAGAWHGLAWG